MPRSLIGIIFTLISFTAIAAGDPERGATLNAVCSACHGADGNSPAPSFPSIAGQGEAYLAKQMREMKSGARNPGAMAGIMDMVPDGDIDDLAAYYAGQDRKGGAADPDLVALGETIYRAGIKRKSIAACTACHSPRGQGVDAARFPALAGQWPEYTEAQLKAFRDGDRHNDGEAKMMRTTALDLSDKEISAVASYLYGLR